MGHMRRGEGIRKGSVRPLKRFGQHFLKDPNIARRMVKAMEPGRGDHVLEIGTGEGILTRAILESEADPVTTVEIDRRLQPLLKKNFGPDRRVRLIFGDILRVDFAEIAGTGPKLRLIGNLPYCITSPVLFRMLERRDVIRDAVVMMQREVAGRMTAAPGSKAYGVPSVLFQAFARLELLFRIPAQAFSPVPAVESAVIRIRFEEEETHHIEDEVVFKRILKMAFQQRRKMLKNTLKPYSALIAASGMSALLSDRPEDIDVRTWVALSNHIARHL